MVYMNNFGSCDQGSRYYELVNVVDDMNYSWS